MQKDFNDQVYKNFSGLSGSLLDRYRQLYGDPNGQIVSFQTPGSPAHPQGETMYAFQNSTGQALHRADEWMPGTPQNPGGVALAQH